MVEGKVEVKDVDQDEPVMAVVCINKCQKCLELVVDQKENECLMFMYACYLDSSS